MPSLVAYATNGSVARITMDDGKVNALSPSMLGELDTALDRAVSDKAVAVVLSGRAGIFSGGFDLTVLRQGGPGALDMLRKGFTLAERLLSFPTPVVMACSGHAIAMGSFVVLCGDYRIGVTGPFRITANEVAIGLTVPHAAIAICRQRLAPAQFNRAVILAEVFSPEDAVGAGFLDVVVAPSELEEASARVAEKVGALDGVAHLATKQRVRADLLRDLRLAIDEELGTAPD